MHFDLRHPFDVRFALDSNHCADIPGRQLRAKIGHLPIL